jgi:hypothetical protein
MSSRILAAAATAAFLISAGAAGAEQLAAWDQARVTKYGKELTVATDNLRRALDAVGIQNIAQQNAMFQVKDTVRLLDTAAGGLASSLEAGKGREETLPRYKRLQVLRRDAEREGRSADIPEAVFEKVFAVGNALIKLRPYYEEQPMDGEKKAP